MDTDPVRRCRAAVRRLTSGVSVLTFWHDGAAHATTVSSAIALSRTPLLIGISLSLGSRFAQLLARHDRFAVNVLSDRQAVLAGWFSDPGRPAGLRQFDAVDWEPDGFSGAPLIRGSLARLACRRTDRFRTGDHELLVAEVVAAAAGAGEPLLSHAGGLHESRLRTTGDRSQHPATAPTYGKGRP